MMRVSGVKSLAVVVLILSGVAILLDAWFPSIHYQAYRLGILSPTAIGGEGIRMKGGWYELANSKKGIGSLFFSSDTEKIWLAKADWPRYGRVNNLRIWKMQLRDIERYEQNLATGTLPPSIRETKQYPWGTVLLGIDGTSGIVMGSWLFLSGDDASRFREALNEIESISPSGRSDK